MSACVCVQTLEIFKQNKCSSMCSRIDGTVFQNNPNLKNAFSLDDDPICLLFIVFSVRQIITVACCVRKPQPESVQTLLQSGKRIMLSLHWNFILILVHKVKNDIHSYQSKNFCFYLSISERNIILKCAKLLFPSWSWSEIDETMKNKLKAWNGLSLRWPRSPPERGVNGVCTTATSEAMLMLKSSLWWI